jgi:succinylarginine dihydrolase
VSGVRVSEAGDRTVPLAEALESRTFFQAAHSEDGRALVLAFAGEPSASVRQQLRDAAAPIRVEFRVVAHSWPQLKQVMDQISQDLPMWEARGAQVSGWGPDWTSNRVHVGLVKFEPSIARSIEAHYGGELVEVLPNDERPVLLCTDPTD